MFGPLFPLGDPPFIGLMFYDGFYYGFHGPMRCAISLCLFIASQVASLRYPLAPFLGHQLVLKLVTPWAVVTSYYLILIPFPARDLTVL